MLEGNTVLRTTIRSLGVGIPEKILTNKDLEKMVNTSHEWIVERTGISSRRVLKEGETNSDLGERAAKQALDRANVPASALDLIIYCTNTWDKILPATGCTLQERIGAKNAVAYDLVAACSGWLVGLAQADYAIRSGCHKNVLVLGAEAMSRLIDWKDRNTCVLFGDGAGAALLGPCEEKDGSYIYSTRMLSDGWHRDILTVPAGGSEMPATVEVLNKREQYMHMDGKVLFKHAVRSMLDRSQEVLKEHGISFEELDWMVPHQANIRIIRAMEERLSFPREKIVVNLERYGNTSAASIPIALEEAYQSGRIKKGDLVLLTSFGAGLTSAATLVRM